MAVSERQCVVCEALFDHGHPARNTCSQACNEQKLRATTARYRQRVRARPKRPRREQECGRCHQILPASAFDLNRTRASGLQNYCKACRYEYAQRPDQQQKDQLRKHVWYLLHYEETRRTFRERFSHDPAFRWQILQSNRARYYADPKRHYERQRERQREQRQWEAEDRRRCFCGRALPAEGERWFCQPKCKVQCARFVCGLTQ